MPVSAQVSRSGVVKSVDGVTSDASRTFRLPGRPTRTGPQQQKDLLLSLEGNDKWPRDAGTSGAVAPEMEARMHSGIYDSAATGAR